jgi:hypothetical protein
MAKQWRLIWSLIVNGLALAACSAAPSAAPTAALPTVAIYTTREAAPALIFTPHVVGATSVPTQANPTVASFTAGVLLAGQHLSANGSYTQTETEAVGPMLCQIRRGSPAFGQLTSVSDPDILFNQWEGPPYDEDNRLMHLALVHPLFTLRDRVKAEWGGEAKLLVTAAYDSTREDHDLAQPNLDRRYSLHFEGRALDLVTLPADEAHLSRLCGLAYAAGFSWVNHESDHCHVSVKAQSLCERYSGQTP